MTISLRPWVRGCIAASGFLCASCLLAGDPPAGLDAPPIVAALKRSADWQLAEPTGNTVANDWVAAPLYDGLLRLSEVTGDPRYLAAVLRFGRQVGWRPLERKYHADDFAVCHAWLEVHRMDPSRRERLDPTRTRIDAILAAPRTEELDMRYPKRFPGVAATDRWTWCDALYMAPPTLARLATIVGGPQYLAFMDSEFRFTHDRLFDRTEHLFFRDANYPDKRTPSGRKVFWSRGNGWVYGGLALLIEQLPADHPSRGFYVALFREMTGAVLAAQQADGLWTPSLLDPGEVPVGETSGSGFFVFGLVWGVNQGILDRAAHLPAIARGWKGLLSRVRGDGYVGYVQRIGHAPDAVNADSRQDYGTGAFLLAGSELVKLLGGATPAADRARFLAEAEALARAEADGVDALLISDTKPEVVMANRALRVRVTPVALRTPPFDSGLELWRECVLPSARLGDLTAPPQGAAIPGAGAAGWVGLWADGKPIAGKSSRGVRVVIGRPNEVAVLKSYRLPLDGKDIEEQRILTLRRDDRWVCVRSRFVLDRDPQPGLQVALGVGQGGAGGHLRMDPARGLVAWSETTRDGEAFTALVADRAFDTVVAATGGTNLCLLKTDAVGEVRFRIHCGAAALGDGPTLEAFVARLTAPAR